MPNPMPLFLDSEYRMSGKKPYAFFQPSTGKVGFSNGIDSERTVPVTKDEERVEVSDKISQVNMDKMIKMMQALLGTWDAKSKSQQDKEKENLEAFGMDEKNEARMLNEDTAMEGIDLKNIWKNGDSVEEVVDKIIDIQAAKGNFVDKKDAREGLFLQVYEMAEKGYQLNAEQDEWLDVMKEEKRVLGHPKFQVPSPDKI